MVRRHPASIEMRTPAIVSAMVHVFVLGAAVLNLDFFARSWCEAQRLKSS